MNKTHMKMVGLFVYGRKENRSRFHSIQSVWLLIMLTLTTSAWSQQRIGYVNMNVLINESPQILEANRILTEEFEPRNRAIEQKEADLKLLESRITQEGPLMTADDLAKLQERARILERQVRRTKEDLNDEITIRNSQLVEEVQNQIRQVVSAYAKENEYDVILINAILYVTEEVDLTDEILERLKQDFAKTQ
ncbi:OmpH family outer membrane protein [Marinicella sp. W31]|uniref:OmpH family outer membrane protein n=1 Tax=Marinicella sp. W31 TaxID=3023713 RepID=UPI0037573098